MQPDIRRIVAVDAHRRKTGRCPTIIHAMGTGETFYIEPTADGFVDLESACHVRCEASGVTLSESNVTIATGFTSDIAFTGFDPLSCKTFFGRAGGGATVTIYDDRMSDYFQYAVAVEPAAQAASGVVQAS